VLGVGGDEGARTFLRELIERVRDNRSISDFVAPNVDDGAIHAQLHRVCSGPVEIESIAGNHLRVDAVVTTGREVARIVFAHDEAGRLNWLHVYVKPPPFRGVSGGRIIVVNGPSGAGKSTLMHALQGAASFPLVVLDEPEQIGSAQSGYLIWRDTAPALHRGYLAAICALASAGNHVALAAAGHTQEEIADAFKGVPLVRVGMFCDLDVLVAREQRTGRWAGIAAQSLGVHDGWTYDLEFDTTNGPDPLELALRVLHVVGP
jgi:chloramphenicol 3-O-phosphotransferase